MQRQHGFNGGIQKGTSATDDHARFLDANMKSLQVEIEREISHLGFRCMQKLDDETCRQYGILVGCAPDGGLWFKDGKLIAAFEGKKQGTGGNAIERWEKNYNICKQINPNIKYVTFGSREGFTEKGYPYKYAKTMLNRENKDLNTLYESGQSWFVNPEGFDRQTIKDLMKKTLLEEAS